MRKLRILLVLATLFLGSVTLSQLDGIFRNGFQVIPESLSFTPDWFKDADRLNQLETLRRVLSHVKESYVDPKRVSPQIMFEKALERISTSVAEVRILRPQPNRIILAVDNERKEFSTDISTLYALHSSLIDALKFVRTHKKSVLSDEDLEIAVVNGVMSTLDPHSNYLPKELYAETKVGTSGKFGGLGIVIGVRDSKLTIIAPLDDTPASRAGLKAGDTITKIGDESTVNMDLTEAVEKMRGPKGVPVVISILRKGWTVPHDFTLVRDIIKIVSVESQLLTGNIGYVKLKSFQGNTIKDLSHHLELLTKQIGGNLKGLILDMRNNPGGLLDQAVSVSDKFLEQGSIVTTVGLSNSIREEEKATGPGTEPKYPLVVLVNEGSASASEIVTGALKYQDRAIIFGQRTFGKGSVQSIFDLPDKGALKLTIAQYLTPGNHSIQSIGVVPDVEFIPATFAKDSIRLSRVSHNIGESELEHHFDNPIQNEVVTKPEQVVQYVENRPESDPAEDEAKPQSARGTSQERIQDYLKDFEIRTALELIKRSKENDTRKELLTTFKDLSKSIESEESKKLEVALLARKIDWSFPQKTTSAEKCRLAKLSSSILPLRESARAGDKMKFSLTLENPGACTLYRSRAISQSKNYLFSEREFLFGRVLPGQKITRDISIEIPKSMPTHLAEMTFQFDEASGIKAKEHSESVLVRGLPVPVFAFLYDIRDEKGADRIGNGNGLIERGETVELNVRIKNVGEGPLGEAIASLKNLNGKSIFLKRGRTPIKSLKPGQEDEISFYFDVKPSLASDDFKMELSLFDNMYRVSNTKTLSFHVERDPKVILKSQNLTAQKDAPIFLNPDETSVRLGMVSQGSPLTSVEQFEDFYRMKLPKGQRGWSKKSDWRTQVTQIPAKPVFTWAFFIPPTIKTEAEKLAFTPSKEKFVRLTGELIDDRSMKDFYVVVNEKKVFYQSFPSQGGLRQIFDTTIPLESGMNRILLVARDQEEMSQRYYFVVQRPLGEKESNQISVSHQSSDDPFENPTN